MKLWNYLSRIRVYGIRVVAEICMAHAMQIRQTSGPEVLNWTAVDLGEPGSGQVRLRQATAGLKYIDVNHRTGYYPQPFPIIPGLEGAGTVEAVAPDVRDLTVGDRVAYAGPHRGRSFALKDAADAHKAFEARATSGATILTIQPGIHRSLP